MKNCDKYKESIIALVITLTVFIFGIVFIFILKADILNSGQLVPKEGVWFCEELQMQISFDTDTESYILAEGIKVKCAIRNEKGTDWIEVFCEEYDNQYYARQETVLYAESVSYSDTQFIVRDQDGKELVFLRSNLPQS